MIGARRGQDQTTPEDYAEALAAEGPAEIEAGRYTPMALDDARERLAQQEQESEIDDRDSPTSLLR